jgi:RNA polymerase sigma-70 factor (ECF subfamily)
MSAELQGGAMTDGARPTQARLRALAPPILRRARKDEVLLRQTWTDDRLMEAIGAEDEYAFVALYERYVDLVYSTAIHVLADAQLAEDATQDVFMRIWRRPGSFIPERGRFMSWLLSVARNRAVDELRVRGRRRRREVVQIGLPNDEANHADTTRDADPALAAQLGAERELIHRALTTLPVDQRRALQLAYFGGLTHQEIAITLKQPLGTVKTRIRLGLQKLRRTLEEEV